MTAHTILIVSAQGSTLQEMILTNNIQATIDVWPDSSPLLEQLSQNNYDLLIIDLSFLIDPVSFYDRLNRNSPPTAVLVLAPNRQRAQAIQQLQLGAADYLLHPVDPLELPLKVERILEAQTLKSTVPPASDANEVLTLLEASQELNHTLQLDEVLRVILARTELVPATDLARIFLADRTEHLSQREAVSLGPHEWSKETNLLFGLAQHVAQSHQIFYNQKKNGAEWENLDLQSALLIPLIARDKLTGVLALGSKLEAAFSDSQIRWLSIFCDRAAIAIENANLFQDLSSAYIDLAQSREKILQSRNTLQALLEGITDDLYIVDHDLTITALNQTNSNQPTHQPDNLIGKSYLSPDWTQLAPGLLKTIKKVLQTGQATTWIPPKKETQPYLRNREFRIYPIYNRLGQVEQAIIFAQDVSDQRRLRASLFRSANLAAVGQLAGSVAHQINNPLTVAMVNSQLILVEADPHSETHEFTTDILKSTERIQSIVRNLMEFSNQGTYFFVETDLITTIDDALALVMRSLEKINCEVLVDYQAQPRLSASVSHLKLVWMNLLLNARDAITGHPGHPQITVSTEMVSEREVKVVITDNGIGMPEENIEQIYRPFFTTKPIGKALGLGLYSAHTIIEQHNGQINVSSNPGIGTAFEIILPLDNPRDV